MAKESKKRGAKKQADLTEEELQEQLRKEMEAVTVKDVVSHMMMTLSSLGYQRLGIPAEQNEKFKDLDQAKFAIDSFSALVKASEGNIAEDELSAFKNALANLQLQFVSAGRDKEKTD